MKRDSNIILNLFLTVMSFFSIFQTCPVRSENRANLDSVKIKSQYVSIFFWNVENLYDTYDDTTKLDNEFTSQGQKHWNWLRFSTKLNHVAKTILAAGKWNTPVIIGLCEIENRYVLNKLIYETPLKPFHYKIVHHESPDQRGVDVALLYRPEYFTVINERIIPVKFPFDTLSKTRDILMVKGKLMSSDTIFLFVNHWPSRRGGYAISKPRRNFVASVLRTAIDSIQRSTSIANIVVMGDFNDEPEDESLAGVLGARTIMKVPEPSELYNLMGIRNRGEPEGTLRYRDQWTTFDQFVVSGALMAGLSGIETGPDQVKIIKASFLMEDDNTYFGEKLKRTYSGPRYTGGFSDHLPVQLILRKSAEDPRKK